MFKKQKTKEKWRKRNNFWTASREGIDDGSDASEEGKKKSERKGLGKVRAETAEGYPDRFERGQRTAERISIQHVQLATFNFFTRKFAKDSGREVWQVKNLDHPKCKEKVVGNFELKTWFWNVFGWNKWSKWWANMTYHDSIEWQYPFDHDHHGLRWSKGRSEGDPSQSNQMLDPNFLLGTEVLHHPKLCELSQIHH